MDKGADIKTGGEFEDSITEDLERVIYSPAVEDDSLELKKTRELKIPTLKYPQALGELVDRHTTLAVSGTHGKSTTTSMLASILIEAGLDPTVIVGTRLAEFGGSNFRKGKSKYLIIEADEYDRAFWSYKPHIAVITNIDEDHLDTYGDMAGVVSGFNQYLKNLPADSIAILNSQDEHTQSVVAGVSCKIGFFNEIGIELNWPLQIPGSFNQINAEAAWQVAKLIGVERNVAFKALQDFKGVWRRLEKLEPIQKIYPEDTTFFSDYGHHPTEIRTTLEGLKSEYPDKQITIIFQPHQIKRVTMLFDDFIEAFDSADKVCLLPIYQVAGREGEGGKTSEDLYEALLEREKELDKNTRIFYKETLKEALAFIEEGVVIFMGAGDIDTSVREHFRSKLMPREGQVLSVAFDNNI